MIERKTLMNGEGQGDNPWKVGGFVQDAEDEMMEDIWGQIFHNIAKNTSQKPVRWGQEPQVKGAESRFSNPFDLSSP